MSRKRCTTAAYYVSFTAVGMCVASFGPALLSLAEQTGSELDSISVVFSARSLAYFVGSSIGGPIVDKLNAHVLMAFALLLTAAGMAVSALAKSVALLALCVSASGLAMGLLDAGTNVLLIWLHGEHVSPYMQGMHCAFAVGALASPLLVRVAVVATGTFRASFYAMAVACTATALTLPLLRPPANRAMPPSACSEASTPAATPRPAARPGDDTDEACDVRPPVTPAGSDDHSQGPVAKTGPDSVISLLGGILGMPLLPRELGVVIFTALLMLMYVGTEASCGGFLTSFAVLSEGLSESTGQYLTAAFWGSLAAGRLLAVPLSMRWSSRRLLMVDLCGCLVASAMLVLTHATGSQALLWASTTLLGVSMASVFPTALTHAEDAVPLTGRITGLLIACAALGEMLVPLATGNAMQAIAPSTFVWVVLIAVSLATASTIALSVAAWPLLRYQRALSRVALRSPGAGSVEIPPA